jgi:hypothetical protein
MREPFEREELLTTEAQRHREEKDRYQRSEKT